MKNSRAVFLPAALAAAASLALIVYAWLGIRHGGPPPLHGQGPRRDFGPRPDRGAEELFRTLGTCAVFLAAASYAWLRLKKSRRSASVIVRHAVKIFDKLHKWTGYAAILLIGIHGFYFLTQAAVKKETYTGIAAFILLLTAGTYGFLIRRVSNRYMRKAHFGLASAFAAAALVHVGGTVIMAALSVAALWSLAWWIERSAKSAEQTRSEPDTP